MELEANPDWLGNVEAFIATRSGARSARLKDPKLMVGGAIQENWSAELHVDGGPHEGTHQIVIRTDAQSSVGFSLSRSEEFARMRLAHEAGVRVPEPLWDCCTSSVMGRPFTVMRRIDGMATGHLLVKSMTEPEQGDKLVAEIGRELAKVHALEAPAPLPSGSPTESRIAQFRLFLDDLGTSHPVLEWALKWMEHSAPENQEWVFCHHDFRTGNIMVADGKITGILDWEFSGAGDRYEDLGWFCAECWRFSEPSKEAGGLGSRDAFYDAYAEEAEIAVDDQAVRFWEVVAHLRWAIIALAQTARFTRGEEETLELGLTGLLIPRLEERLLQLTALEKW